MADSPAQVVDALKIKLDDAVRLQLPSNCSPPGPETAIFRPLSALRAHTKVPYKMDFHWKTLRALNRPWAARTIGSRQPRATWASRLLGLEKSQTELNHQREPT